MGVQLQNPVKTNLLTGIMARINLDRKLKIMQEEGQVEPEQLDLARQQFAALGEFMPPAERQAIAAKLNSISSLV